MFAGAGREITEDDAYYNSAAKSAARSSISDIEHARRNIGSASGGRVSSLGFDEDDKSSVISEKDDSVRLRSKSKLDSSIRRSLLPTAEHEGGRLRNVEDDTDMNDAERMMSSVLEGRAHVFDQDMGAGDVTGFQEPDYDYNMNGTLEPESNYMDGTWIAPINFTRIKGFMASLAGEARGFATPGGEKSLSMSMSE
jgi:hypothetical protein